jgi:hypothetical protein
MTFTDVLTELGIDWTTGPHRHVSEGWVGVRPCPGCGSNDYHLGFPLSGAFASCWRCGSRSTVMTLAELTNRPSPLIRELIKGRIGDLYLEDPIPKGRYQPPAGSCKLQPAHKEYLRSRGIDPDEAERLWGVFGTSQLGDPSWSVVMPVVRRGLLASWTSRKIGNDPRRRYTSARKDQEAEPIKSCLYGADLARNAVVVFEGPMTCLRVGPGATCTFGIDYTQAQVARIAKFAVRAIAFDPEPEAQAQARRLERELRCSPGRTYLAELESPDGPAWPSDGEVKELRRRFLDG